MIRRTSLIVTAVLVLTACSAGSSAHSGGQFAVSFSLSLIAGGVMALVLIFLLRDNILAYVCYGLLSGLVRGHEMMTQSAPLYQIHGWALLAVILALVLGSWAWAFRRSELAGSHSPSGRP